MNPPTAEVDRLVLIMTDGEPSDGTFEGFRSIIQSKGKKVFVSIMMCTEDDDVVEKYEKKVDAIKNVDVHDDYFSEKAQCERRGKKLSLNTYLVKCILGPKLL